MSLAVSIEKISLEKDIFYTWGWNSDNKNNIEFLANPHLAKLKNTYSIEIDRILFIGSGMPKYHYRFCTALLPDDMPKYFEDKKIFFQILKDEVKKKACYRPYPHEYGWEEVSGIKKIYPEIQILSTGLLVNWMKKVKLVVIDHPHTSFLEALTINVPCIFFWDSEVNLMRPEADPYFELLREAGILYMDAESAAKKINEIWDDVPGWWQQPKVQKAKDEFCYQFARTSKNWCKEWVKVFRRLSDENQ